MVWIYVLGMITTVILELLVCLIIYNVTIVRAKNGGKNCVSCRFYSVGTNTCIRNCTGARTVEDPVTDTCDKHKEVL